MKGIIHGRWNPANMNRIPCRIPFWIPCRTRTSSGGCRAGIRTAVFLLLLATGGLTSCEDLITNVDSGDPRDKLEDTWKVDETRGGGKKSTSEVYYVEISKHPYDSSRVVIYNFYNVQADAEAVLSGTALTLPLQTLEGGYAVRGSGQVQGTRAGEIIWTYRVDDGSGVEENVTAVYSRTSF